MRLLIATFIFFGFIGVTELLTQQRDALLRIEKALAEKGRTP
jgi:hypothetical protein